MKTGNPFEELEDLIESRFNELKSMIQTLIEPPKPIDVHPYLYSLKELAEFLNCSIVTAQKLKNAKRIPYYQTGRKLVFEKAKVLEAMTPLYRIRKR
jgi:excisionase family DNA binding protein